jgi:RimJ/RimL family protein N-acetyltransferase
MTPRLLTDRLILREWTESDREPFARMNADARVMEFLGGAQSREASDQSFDRVREHFREHGFCFFAAEERGRDASFIGFIGLAVPGFEAHFTPCVEIGWRLLPEYWNQGLATEGARVSVQYARESLGLEEIVAFTTETNLRSRKVMEKLGMTRNPRDDFDHPSLPAEDPLRPHVLYRLRLR